MFYSSLYRLPNNATFADGRAGVIASAKAAGFNASQVQAVKDAFRDVGILGPNEYTPPTPGPGEVIGGVVLPGFMSGAAKFSSDGTRAIVISVFLIPPRMFFR